MTILLCFCSFFTFSAQQQEDANPQQQRKHQREVEIQIVRAFFSTGWLGDIRKPIKN